jgi:peptidoglycan/LPS O-acetylase OafA/YrhL
LQNNILHKSTNLDLLRAVAVTFVVVDHTSKFLGHPFVLGREMNWLGRLGVMFFFVHTCTVLMLSLERLTTETTRARAWLSFYIRRIFRIYPLSIFAVTVVVLFHIPSAFISGRYLFGNFDPSRNEVVGSLLLIQNVWPRGSREIIGVLWSLPFEVQMYVLLPIIFLFQSRLRRLWPLFAVWIGSWIPAHLFMPLHYAPHFLAGVIAFALASRQRSSLWPSWLFPITLGVLTMAFFAWRQSTAVGGMICFILGSLLPRFATIKSPTVNRITYNMAKYSYGVYLSHLFCLWVAFDVVRSFHVVTFGILLLSMPVLLFHCIESPMIQLGIWLGSAIARHPIQYASTEAVPPAAP